MRRTHSAVMTGLIAAMLFSLNACGRTEPAPQASEPSALKPYSIMVFGEIAPQAVEFEGHYVYIENGKEVREDISGKGNRSKAIGAEALTYCEVRKTSEGGWISLTIRQGTDELFASEEERSNKPIIYRAQQ